MGVRLAGNDSSAAQVHAPIKYPVPCAHTHSISRTPPCISGAPLQAQVWARTLANGDVAVVAYNALGGVPPPPPCRDWNETKNGYYHSCGGVLGTFSDISLQEVRARLRLGAAAARSRRPDPWCGSYRAGEGALLRQPSLRGPAVGCRGKQRRLPRRPRLRLRAQHDVQVCGGGDLSAGSVAGVS